MGNGASVRPGAVIGLVAAIIAVRVLGLSAILPVFTPYGETLSDSSLLVGLALSAYGLTMALMQIPLGAWSDRIGRRPVMFLGLSVFVVGNLVAWRAEDIAAWMDWSPIWVLIVARLVEGLGAVSSVGTALLTDVVPEARRTSSLAIAGIGAGVSFLVGVSAGPFVADAVGVPGLFLITAILGLLLLPFILLVAPKGVTASPDVARPGIAAALSDVRLLRIDVAGFVMNLTLVAVMYALPVLALGGDTPRLSDSAYRWSLVGMVITGGVLMMGLIRRMESKGRVQQAAAFSATGIGIGALGLLGVSSFWPYVVLGVLYFGSHAGQSASLPSLVGRVVSARRRGAAMGALNTWTFMGSFVGGPLGALLLARGSLALGASLLVLGIGAAALLMQVDAATNGPSG